MNEAESKISVYPDLGINISKTRMSLSFAFRNQSQFTLNFELSDVDTIACFCGREAYVASANMIPILKYQSSSVIAATTISPNGRYWLIQNANNKANDEDSGTTLLIDVKQRVILFRADLPPINKMADHIHVDNEKSVCRFYCGADCLEYDFTGECLNPSLYKAVCNKWQLRPKVHSSNPQDDIPPQATDIWEDYDRLYELCKKELWEYELERLEIFLYITNKYYNREFLSFQLLRAVQNALSKHFINIARREKSEERSLKRVRSLIPEIPDEVWNDPYLLYPFCESVFEEFEIKELNRHIDKIKAGEGDIYFSKDETILFNMRGMLQSHYHWKNKEQHP